MNYEERKRLEIYGSMTIFDDDMVFKSLQLSGSLSAYTTLTADDITCKSLFVDGDTIICGDVIVYPLSLIIIGNNTSHRIGVTDIGIIRGNNNCTSIHARKDFSVGGNNHCREKIEVFGNLHIGGNNTSGPITAIGNVTIKGNNICPSIFAGGDIHIFGTCNDDCKITCLGNVFINGVQSK